MLSLAHGRTLAPMTGADATTALYETTLDLYDALTGQNLGEATPAQAQASEDASVEGGGYGVITVDGTGRVLDAGSWAARQPDALAVFTR